MSKNNQYNSGIVLVSDIYPDNLIVLPLENRPVFPGLALPLVFVNQELVKRIEYAIKNQKGFIGVSLIKDINEKNFIESSLHKTGTLLKIIKIVNKSKGGINIFAQAVTRFHFKKATIKKTIPHWQVEYEYEEEVHINDEIKAFTMAIINSVKELIKLNPMFHEQMKLALNQVGLEKPGLLMDLVASFLSADADKLQVILEAVDLYVRSEKLLVLLKEEIELSKLQKDIQKQIEEKLSQNQREFFLREQLKVIKKELGLEKDDKTTEIEAIDKKIKKIRLTDEAHKVVKEELDKLNSLETGSAEFNVTRTYLNWLTDLPWGVFSEENHNLKLARKILDEQHYGLK